MLTSLLFWCLAAAMFLAVSMVLWMQGKDINH